MGKLTNLNEIEDISSIDNLLDKDIIIFEDIQGSKIYVNWDGESFTIKPKSVSNSSINMVDLAMQKYYNKAINYFEQLDKRVRGLMSKKWWFVFEYFPDNQPGNIEYSKVPKNNLVLTSILKGNKFDYTIEEVIEYARLFDVDHIPIIFKGKLSEKSVEAIKYFLNTSEEDLEYVFGEKSFAYFFYKLLNPNIEHSFLMDNDFQKNMEKIILKVEDQEESFEILNPLYQRISDKNSTDFMEIYNLILINFLNFSQTINLDNLKVKGEKRDEIYIYLICKLFNAYMAEVKEDLLNFEFTIPEFFDKDKFRINSELIKSKLTKEYISDSKKFEYIFKVILGSFNKKKKKPIGLFTENTIEIFNKFVGDIKNKIDNFLNKKTETELNKNRLLDFSDYFEIKYDTDGDDMVYPDVYKEIEKRKDFGTKKKKHKAVIGYKGKDQKK